MDIFCNLIYPAHETLFALAKFRRKETYNQKFTHWTTYWIFYSVLCIVGKVLYFFPFAYEIRVMLVVLMAHPKIEAASMVQGFFVTNPLIMIKIIDGRSRMKRKLDTEYLKMLKQFTLFKEKPAAPNDQVQAAQLPQSK